MTASAKSTPPTITGAPLAKTPSYSDSLRNKSITNFLHRIASNEIPRYEHSKLFIFPFSVSEDRLKKLDKKVLELLQDVPVLDPVDFASIVRFKDLSSLRFDDFGQFISEAGDKDDNPESVALEWSKFSFNSLGEVIAGRVSLRFSTEQMLEPQRASPESVNVASITFDVSGSDRDWTDRAYRELYPHLETVQLGGVYRPLWIFRGRWLISVVSQVTAFIGFFVGMQLVDRLSDAKIFLTNKQIVSLIVNTADVNAKIDILARQLLTPDQNPWWQPVLSFVFGAISFGVIFVTTMRLLPKLTPNSSVAIGLSKDRAERQLNVFRFIIFNLLVLGITIPVVIEIVQAILKKML